MDENPYRSPREEGYCQPKANPVVDWLRDRLTELAFGLLAAVALLPIFVAFLWICGEF